MNGDVKGIAINCFNCRGLRNTQKRQSVFTWLKTNHSGITFLQESHSTSIDELKWIREWGGEIYFSHGEFNARGVAILIPQNMNSKFIYKNGYKDNFGRFILINCEIEGKALTLINIYCPTKDNQTAQISFLDMVKSKLEEYSDTNIVLGGDLNTYLNVQLDKKGGKTELLSTYAQQISNMCTEYSLVDIWRVRNPIELKFTRRENSKLGIVQSRLDYFLISEGLSYLIKNSSINIGLCSDHSLIKIELDLCDSGKRGQGVLEIQ